MGVQQARSEAVVAQSWGSVTAAGSRLRLMHGATGGMAGDAGRLEMGVPDLTLLCQSPGWLLAAEPLILISSSIPTHGVDGCVPHAADSALAGQKGGCMFVYSI